MPPRCVAPKCLNRRFLPGLFQHGVRDGQHTADIAKIKAVLHFNCLGPYPRILWGFHHSHDFIGLDGSAYVMLHAPNTTGGIDRLGMLGPDSAWIDSAITSKAS